jgi:hypothetical protein
MACPPLTGIAPPSDPGCFGFHLDYESGFTIGLCLAQHPDELQAARPVTDEIQSKGALLSLPLRTDPERKRLAINLRIWSSNDLIENNIAAQLSPVGRADGTRCALPRHSSIDYRPLLLGQ